MASPLDRANTLIAGWFPELRMPSIHYAVDIERKARAAKPHETRPAPSVKPPVLWATNSHACRREFERLAFRKVVSIPSQVVAFASGRRLVRRSLTRAPDAFRRDYGGLTCYPRRGRKFCLDVFPPFTLAHVDILPMANENASTFTCLVAPIDRAKT